MSDNCKKHCLHYSDVKHFVKTVSVLYSHRVEAMVKMNEQSCAPKKP